MEKEIFEEISQHLREKFSLRDDWHAWKVEAVGEGEPTDIIVLVTGAECPKRFVRGLRKGRVNFRRRESVPKTLPITLEKYRELIAAQ